MSFDEKVEEGSRSTSSVQSELEKVKQATQTMKGVERHFGLREALKNASPSAARALLSKVISGDLSPEFLKHVLPIITSGDSRLMSVFTSRKGGIVLKLLSSAYSQRRLDISLLQDLVDSPGAKELLRSISESYAKGGLSAVRSSDILRLVQSLDLSELQEAKAPILRLIRRVVNERTLTIPMVANAISEVKMALGNKSPRPNTPRRDRSESPISKILQRSIEQIEAGEKRADAKSADVHTSNTGQESSHQSPVNSVEETKLQTPQEQNSDSVSVEEISSDSESEN